MIVIIHVAIILFEAQIVLSLPVGTCPNWLLHSFDKNLCLSLSCFSRDKILQAPLSIFSSQKLTLLAVLFALGLVIPCRVRENFPIPPKDKIKDFM